MLIRSGMGMQLSGSVGGVTASRNRYGAYLRNRTVPVNPQTNRQLQVQAAFAAATVAWRTLTAVQRGSWESYAAGTPMLNKLGETVILSGNAMFVRSNAFRQQAALSILTDAPPTPGLAFLGSSLVATAVTGLPGLTMVGGNAVGPCIVQYSPVVSAGVASFKGPFSIFAMTTASATAVVVAAQTGTRYGTWLVGQRRFVRFCAQDAVGKLCSPYIAAVTAT